MVRNRFKKYFLTRMPRFPKMEWINFTITDAIFASNQELGCCGLYTL